MKVKVLISVIFSLLIATFSQATVYIEVSQGVMFQSDGVTPVPTNSLWFMVCSETNTTFGAASGGILPGTYNLGGAFGQADDIIVGIGYINNSPGANGSSDIPFTLTYSGNLGAGEPYAMVWVPQVIITNTTNIPSSFVLNAGNSYGLYSNRAGTDGSDIWNTPSNGYTVFPFGYTADLGGNVPNSAMIANLTVTSVPVPEPATVSILGIGLIMGVMFLRRRNK